MDNWNALATSAYTGNQTNFNDYDSQYQYQEGFQMTEEGSPDNEGGIQKSSMMGGMSAEDRFV